MDHRNGAAVIGFVVGALVALVFAVVISLAPPWVFLETGWRVVVYTCVALAAPPTVWFLQGVARWSRRDTGLVVAWGTIGAMAFDGLAIGFVPALYGQTGDALAWAASSLLFAFASLLVAVQLMLGRTSAARAERVSSPSRA